MTERHWWRCRLVKDGPAVALVSWHGAPIVDGEELDRHHRWQCLLRDETSSRAILLGDEVPIEIHGIGIRNLEKITEAEYEYLKAHGTWAVQHNPSHPSASPKTAIDRRGKSVF